MIVPGLFRADIRNHWDRVRPGLEYVKAVCATDWIPEDIFCLCTLNAAELWLAENDNDGFLILQEKPLSFESGKALLIWVAYREGGGGAETYMNEIQELARRRGCSKIEVWSPRNGMGRLLERYGFETENIIYTKRIDL